MGRGLLQSKIPVGRDAVRIGLRSPPDEERTHLADMEGVGLGFHEWKVPWRWEVNVRLWNLNFIKPRKMIHNAQAWQQQPQTALSSWVLFPDRKGICLVSGRGKAGRKSSLHEAGTIRAIEWSLNNFRILPSGRALFKTKFSVRNGDFFFFNTNLSLSSCSYFSLALVCFRWPLFRKMGQNSYPLHLLKCASRPGPSRGNLL